MNKTIINIALASMLLMSATSCSDFLDVKPTGSLTEDEVFADINNVEPLVTGLYKSYRGCKEGRNGLMSSLGTDETQQGNFQLISSGDQAGMDKYNGQLNPTSTQVKAIWDNRWPAVTSAAKAIYALKRTTPSAKATQLMGEASFMRAMLMYELTMYWGRIPIIDMDRTQELGGGPQPEKDVWEYIVSDFQEAVNDLPNSYDNEPQRATKGAALTMLGRAYMSAPESTGLRDYEKADECFKQVMSMGYELVDNYADLWRYDNPNTKESIFELQFDCKWPDCNYWEFDMGSRACDSWFGQGCSFSGYDFLLPTPFARTKQSEGGLWEEGDKRFDSCIRTDFTYYTNKYSDDESKYEYVTPDLSKTSWTGTTDELAPHIKKWEDFRTDYQSGLGINNMWNSGKNYPMIRYADVLLLHAECLNELGQTSEAVTLINNTIRKRAFGGTLPADKAWNTGMSKEECFNMLMDERMRELCFEQWRRIDLIRTGKLVELTLKRNEWAKQSGTMQAFHVHYPIPDTEIKTNEDFTPDDQNEGYAKDTATK